MRGPRDAYRAGGARSTPPFNDTGFVRILAAGNNCDFALLRLQLGGSAIEFKLPAIELLFSGLDGPESKLQLLLDSAPRLITLTLKFAADCELS